MKSQSCLSRSKSSSKKDQLSLFSPVMLLALLAVLFTFFMTASGNSKNATRGTGWHKTVMEKDLNRCDSETLYRSIVTNGDAIRSVLQ